MPFLFRKFYPNIRINILDTHLLYIFLSVFQLPALLLMALERKVDVNTGKRKCRKFLTGQGEVICFLRGKKICRKKTKGNNKTDMRVLIHCSGGNSLVCMHWGVWKRTETPAGRRQNMNKRSLWYVFHLEL